MADPLTCCPEEAVNDLLTYGNLRLWESVRRQMSRSEYALLSETGDTLLYSGDVSTPSPESASSELSVFLRVFSRPQGCSTEEAAAWRNIRPAAASSERFVCQKPGAIAGAESARDMPGIYLSWPSAGDEREPAGEDIGHETGQGCFGGKPGEGDGGGRLPRFFVQSRARCAEAYLCLSIPARKASQEHVD